ncbi:DUF7619 domain-containing protein [Psychroserpens sp. MEBiC05023]
MKQLYLFAVFSFLSMQLLAQNVNIPDPNFKAALITNGFDTNGDGEIQLTEAELITELYMASKNISDITGIESFTNLTFINFNDNNLTSIDLSNNTMLEWVEVNNNQLSTIDLSPLIDLYIFNANNNNLTSIIVGDKPNMDSFLASGNQLTTIDFSMIGPTALEGIVLSDNLLTEIIFPSFFFSFSGYLYLDNNQLTSIDLSKSSGPFEFSCQNNNLEYINLKNSQYPETFLVDPNSYFNIENNPNLSYLCVDEVEMSIAQQALIDNGYSLNDVEVNTYCSFLPGGPYFIVEGEVYSDLNSNGCDTNDPLFSGLQFNITDGTTNLGYIIGGTGMYSIPLQAGTYTITPVLENVPYLNVTTESFVVDFPNDSSPFIQDICVEIDESYRDLEIVILPLEEARPGFDTDYKLIYKNKSGMSVDGSVNLIFQDDLMDLVTANPAVDTQIINELTWNFSNLLPFEQREIEFKMNLNTPTETPPLNGGDILVYTASIDPVSNDVIPEDNVSIVNQTVINSFDPNDKTCLEGDTITPDQVGKYVHYMIRFENTGTASAINVVVKDEIDTSKYDMSSLVPLNASHEFVTRIFNNNTVEFIFENINLPFDDANNDGYVLFKIKTLPSLQSGDTFSNDAEIYFDFNLPIVTNDELTMIAETLDVNEHKGENFISMYPNPVTNSVLIESYSSLESVVIYDLNGRQIFKEDFVENKESVTLDMSDLSAGLYLIELKTSSSIINKRILKD